MSNAQQCFAVLAFENAVKAGSTISFQLVRILRKNSDEMTTELCDILEMPEGTYSQGADYYFNKKK